MRHFIKQVWEPRMQNYIILPSWNIQIFVCKVQMCTGLVLAAFLGQNNLNLEDMYFIHSKVIRGYN